MTQMPHKLWSIEPQELYLKVTIQGEWSFAIIKESIEGIKEAANQSGLFKILIDARNQPPVLTTLQRFEIGEYMSKAWSSKYKVAALGPNKIPSTFTETVAVNRGVLFKFFSDEILALNWLMKDI
jgi:hypothetical protein